ncbi:MAG: hypothetical protein GWN37_12390 [Gammaproteobacteria bacterium]|nr:hypothetical protein [Gammaproteobacteria bacterium]
MADVPVAAVGRGEAVERIAREALVARGVEVVRNGGEVVVGAVGEGQILRDTAVCPVAS